MRVTIITDASYCPHTRVAGYGYWIATGRGNEGGGGRMVTRKVHSNVVAEMMAVANALHTSIWKSLVQPGDELLIQTDCMGAITAFQGIRDMLHPQEAATVSYVNAAAKLHGLTITFRHVKGHSGRKEGRYMANFLCDKQAKEQMRIARSIALSENAPKRKEANGDQL